MKDESLQPSHRCSTSCHVYTYFALMQGQQRGRGPPTTRREISADDRGRTDSFTAKNEEKLTLTFTFTFDPRRDIGMIHTHAKNQGQRSVAPKDRVETNGRTCLIALPSSATWSVITHIGLFMSFISAVTFAGEHY